MVTQQDVLDCKALVDVLIADYVTTGRYFTEFVKIPPNVFDGAEGHARVANKFIEKAKTYYVDKQDKDALVTLYQAVPYLIMALMEIKNGAVRAGYLPKGTGD